MNKKVGIVLLLVAISLSILFALTLLKSSKQPTPIQIVVTPSQKNREIDPSFKRDVFIPTYTPEKGSGVDLESPLVADSVREIQKLYPFLPYEKTIETSLNQKVIMVIPDFTSQPNRWTLQVDIFGLDYQLNKEDSEYTMNKDVFITAVSSLYSWIQEKGADPNKIMIIWGDEEYIQNKSQEWLE